jgi:Carboxypeptidase regulatory-like domain
MLRSIPVLSALAGVAACLIVCGAVADEKVEQPAEPSSYKYTVYASSFFETALPPDARLIASSTDGDEVVAPMGISGNGAYELRLFEGKKWEITCRGSDVWCPAVEVSVAESEPWSKLLVFPASSLAGRIRAGEEDELPESVIVQGWLRVEGRSEAVTSFVEESRLDQDGGFQLLGPQGTLDLRISARGRIPAYLWGIEALPTKMLKPVSLKTGGSIAGFAWDGVEELPAVRADVSVLPAGIETDDPGNQRLGLLTANTQTNDRGFFQVEGLAPGMYRLEVSAANRSPEIVEWLAVLEDSETLLDGSIVLTDPPALNLFLDPPVPLPGERWTVRLLRTSRSVPDETKLDVQADALGFARLEGLVPQNYILQILDARGSRIYLEERYIESDLSLDLDLPVVGVEGVLKLNGEPLGAAIQLEAGFKDQARLTADEETGEFAGIVRRPDWKLLIVKIYASDPEFSRTVHVKDPVIEDGVIQLDFDLVGIDLTGDVVDRSGSPAEDASVTAYRSPNGAKTRTAKDGTFTLVALDEGPYELQAEHSKGDSEILPLELVEGLSPPSIRLVLEEKTEIRAVLRTPGGEPVRSAQITVYAAGQVPCVTSVETDVEGRFAFDVTAGTSQVLLQVLAPTQVIWSGCWPVDVPSENPLIVTLPPAPGGRLEIQTTADAELDLPPDTSSRLVIVTSDRGFLEFNEAVNWSIMTGQNSAGGFEPGKWWISGLAAGRQYAVLRSSEPVWKLATGLCLAGPPPDLEWQFLGQQDSAVVSAPLAAR